LSRQYILFYADCGREFRRYADKGNERWKCSRYLVKGKINCRSSIVTEDLFKAAFMRVLGKLDLDEIEVKPKLEPVANKTTVFRSIRASRILVFYSKG